MTNEVANTLARKDFHTSVSCYLLALQSNIAKIMLSGLTDGTHHVDSFSSAICLVHFYMIIKKYV